MKIYFGYVEREEVEASGCDFLEDSNGDCYDFVLTADSDGIRITDSVRRTMPLPHSAVDALYKSLKHVRKLSNAISAGEYAQDIINEV